MTSMMMVDQNKEYGLKELQPPLPGFNLYNDNPAHLSHNGMQSLEMILAIDPSKLELARSLYPIDSWMLASYAVFLHRMTNDRDLIMGVQNQHGQPASAASGDNRQRLLQEYFRTDFQQA